MINRNGLTTEQVTESRKKYGSNQLTSVKRESFVRQLLSSLGDPIIRILLIALAIKMIFLIQGADWYETVGIVIAIFVASFISTISEYGSEKAFEKLQEESSKIRCRVKRNNQIIEVTIDEIVVSDIVMLESGDKIPADGILLDGSLSVDESSMNGEAKEASKVPNEGEFSKLYRGTVVCNGIGTMIVKAVGDKTFYGNLAKEIQEKQPESPLKTRLRGLAQVISKIGYVGAFLVSCSYLFSVIVIQNNFEWTKISTTLSNFPIMLGHILYAMTLSVTIIVVAVPEGLPMMITLVLSSNMKRMLKNNVLVRKMVGIETAGSLNILFTDKTGTLTKGKLEVVKFMTGSLKEYYSEKEVSQHKMYDIVKTSFVCNNASNYDQNGKVVGGNITDRALLQFIRTPISDYQKIKTIPFDSKNKYAITSIRYNKEKWSFVKGAPEILLEYCSSYLSEDGTLHNLFSKRDIYKKIQEATSNGIRVLVMTMHNHENEKRFDHMIFIGLAFIKDEVRKEALEGINLVDGAHIQTVMITGDNVDTARSIGKEVGLIKNSTDLVLTSTDLNNMTDEEIKKILPNLRVVARSLPSDKSRLVRISQEMDLVVGMTGDGVNDAPALKRADVGFAMGSGTEVAKEASDIVILDDNFLSISKAVLFGRTIFKSIRKFIIVQLTINFCAISLSIIGPFIGIDTPITVIQLLWINMVMDTLAGLAFAYEPPLLEYMKEYPKKKGESILNKYMIHQIGFTGFYSALICILFLKSPIVKKWFMCNEAEFMTAFFGLFIFIDIFNSFNARTHRLNLLANILKNRVFLTIMCFVVIVQIILIYHGGTLFRTSGLTFKEFEIMIFIAFSVIPMDWIRKLYLRSRGIKGGV